MDISSADNMTDLLTRFLDVQTKRTQVIAGNIANADTPGYQAKQLQFEDFLRASAKESTLPPAQRGLAGSVGDLKVIEQDSETADVTGNTVDMGREMADLADAGMNFNFGAKLLQSRFRLLRTAIKEGKS